MEFMDFGWSGAYLWTLFQCTYRRGNVQFWIFAINAKMSKNIFIWNLKSKVPHHPCWQQKKMQNIMPFNLINISRLCIYIRTTGEYLFRYVGRSLISLYVQCTNHVWLYRWIYSLRWSFFWCIPEPVFKFKTVSWNEWMDK